VEVLLQQLAIFTVGDAANIKRIKAIISRVGIGKSSRHLRVSG
jgi:hypothetical protein